MNWDMKIDVLVVGGGGCGLVAALAAADHGAEVAIVEKLEAPGGNTVLSTGSIPASATVYQERAGIKDSPESMYEDLLKQSGPHDMEDVLLTLCQQSSSLVEWLVEKKDISLNLITDYKHVGHTLPRLHAPPSKKGEDLVKDLLRSVEKNKIPLAVGNRVKELIFDQDAVIGAEIETNYGNQKIKANKIILATNGFGANRELLARYIPEIANASYFGATGSNGEAIIWSETINAALANMGAYQAYAAISKSLGSLVSWTTIEKGGIIVDERGQRFSDETVGYSEFAGRILNNTNKAFIIFNEKIKEIIESNEEEFHDFIRNDGLTIFDSTEEMSRKLEMDLTNLHKTIDEYNDSALKVKGDKFGRLEFGLAPLKPPFYVCQIIAGLFHTQGGLKIDTKGRVLSKENKPIKNLFAGGGAAAGVSGQDGAKGYASGNGLLTAMGLGKIAGENAAKELRGS